MNTDEMVLALLRRALWKYPINLATDIDWPSIYTELRSQLVASLVDNVLMEQCLDSALKREWSKEILSLLNCNERKMYGQDNLLRLLKAHGISTAILKGTAAAMYYPRPENRTLGDVDFLVPVDRFEETLTLLTANGYHQCSALTEAYCEVLLEKDHVLLELHRGVNTTDGINVDAVNDYALEGLNHLEQHSISGYTFTTLPETENGLVLLSHIRQHLRGGLGLRQIIDWMMYVYHAVDDAAWSKSFRLAAQKCGLDKLAINVTRMCQMYLGLTEDITWCASANESVCSSLMNYIFEGGNFGRKIERYEHATQQVMMKKNYFWKMLTSLQSKGVHRTAVKKHSVLKPFAWAIQIGHYINQIVKRGNVAKTLRGDTKKARQLQEMLEALGIHGES